MVSTVSQLGSTGTRAQSGNQFPYSFERAFLGRDCLRVWLCLGPASKVPEYRIIRYFVIESDYVWQITKNEESSSGNRIANSE